MSFTSSSCDSSMVIGSAGLGCGVQPETVSILAGHASLDISPDAVFFLVMARLVDFLNAVLVVVSMVEPIISSSLEVRSMACFLALLLTVALNGVLFVI